MSVHHIINQESAFTRGLVNHMWVSVKSGCEDELERQEIIEHMLKNKTSFLSWMFLLLEIWYVKVKKWQVVFGWHCDFVFSGKQSLAVCDNVMQQYYCWDCLCICVDVINFRPSEIHQAG
jgi:hypothetical protein